MTISLEKEEKVKVANKKILIYMNPSNGESLQSDSGYIFNKNLINGLSSMNYYFCIISDYDPGWKSTKWFKLDQGRNKYDVRFSFDSRRFRSIIKEIGKFDVFYLNQSEHGSAIKSVFITMGYEKIPIVTYIHYTPIWGFNNTNPIMDPSLNQANLGINIARRQLETCELSNLILTHSEFSKKLLIEAKENLKFDFDEEKIRLIPPPIEHELQELTPKKRTIGDNPRLLYNSRLYNHYGFDTLLSYFKELENYLNLEIHITDPSGKRSPIQDRLDPSVSENRKKIREIEAIKYHNTLERADYLSLLNTVSIGVAPIRPALWSMSTIDMMALKIPVLAPRKGFYPEIIPDQLLYDNKEDFINILKDLIENTNNYERLSKICYENSKIAFPESINRKYDRILKTLSED